MGLLAGQSLAYGNNTFMYVHQSVILKYDPINDAWITLPQKMAKTPRSYFGAALIPQNYVAC
jgi:hypothetical protein